MANNELYMNLKEILRTKVKLEEPKEIIRILEDTIGLFIDKMKSVSKLFSFVFNRLYYTGSYYEGLRVKKATEFDINLVLNFPKNMELEIRTTESPPSFCVCKLKTKQEKLSTASDWVKIKEILKEFFNDNYLMPDKIKNWLQGIIDSTLNSFVPPDNVREIKKSRSGPALTIYIITRNGIQLDVDLVPVLEFKHPDWPPGADKTFLNVIPKFPNDKKFWFIVPKQPPSDLCRSNHCVSYQWRIHFPEIEKHLIHNKGCLKPIIKLLKLLKENQNWSILASYYLKTVVMWAVIKQREIDWKETNMDIIFIKMLKDLKKNVKDSNLPYLFNPKYNLLYNIEPSHAQNIEGRLNRIIRDIENDPQKINEYM